ncbi:MAG TPA: hypothetical protein PLH22_01715 [Candidatus Colwellbacteria bacterium]|nr:hypothetical protein [Candidatus Colwellbacteria bacterium]
MNQRTINILLLILLVVVVVVFMIMVVRRSLDPTAGWSRYENVSQGYSIKYPSSWGPVDPIDESDLLLSNYPEGDQMEADRVVIEISGLNAKPADNNLISFIRDSLAEDGDMRPSGNLVATEINGLQVLKIDHSGGDGPDGPGYYIEKSPTEYLFIAVYGTDYAETAENIVSSFRFLK